MGMVSRTHPPPEAFPPLSRPGRTPLSSAAGSGFRRPRTACEGRAHVLARHHAMGTIRDALRSPGCVHHQLAPFHCATEPSVLGEPGFVLEPRSLLPEPRHAHHTVCLSSVLT